MNVTTQSSAVGQRSYHHQPPSLYVINSFYEWVVEVSADLARIAVRDSAAVKAARVDEITRLLTLEARLLDQGTLAQENQRALAQEAYGHWLALFADECAYWILANIPAADPRQTVALEFHDRRRLLDRVARLGTGFAFSQSPASHTSRQWSGLEIWPSPNRTDEWRARCSFMLVESREGHGRVLSGWNGFVLRETPDGLRIVLKQINLIDCDRMQGNNSFFL